MKTLKSLIFAGILFSPCLIVRTVIFAAVGPSGPPAIGIQFPAQLAPAAGGAISFVQKTGSVQNDPDVDIAFSANNTAGNIILCGASSFNSGGPEVATPTDGIGNTYVFIGSATADFNNAVYAWYALNIGGGANTVTFAGVSGDLSASCVEYSGANTVTPLDALRTRKDTTDARPITSSMTATNDDEMIFLAANHGNGNLTWSAESANWTLRMSSGNGNSYEPLVTADRGTDGSLSAAGTYAAIVKLSGSASNGIVGALITP